MTDMEYIASRLSKEDILCQLAEEASELAQAALKLRRAMTQTNPTPITVGEAVDTLHEECGDVVGSFQVWAKKNNLDDEIYDTLDESIESKFSRWAKRLREKEDGDDKD